MILAGAAGAQTTPPPITKSDYALEIFQGPYIGPSRFIGLAGAYSGYAEGVDAATANAAAPAVREPFSFKHFDWDISLDGSLPGAYGHTDFDNRGPTEDSRSASTVNGFLYAHAGAQLQIGQFGASVTGEFFQYSVTPVMAQPGQGGGLTLIYGRFHALAGYGFADNQIVIGGGARIVSLAIKDATHQIQQIAGGGQTLVSLDGAAPEFGTVIKPNGFPLRLGATLRLPVQGTQSTGTQTSDDVQRAGTFIVPQKAVLPWELEMGFALQLGPRPLNPKWLEPHDMEAEVRGRIDNDRARRRREQELQLERASKDDRPALARTLAQEEAAVQEVEDARLDAEIDRLYAVRRARDENWPRERILVVGALLLSGPSEQAVALEGFVTQERELVGRNVSLSPRVGLESEPIPNLLHGRVGSYLEPSRFDEGSLRQHFTFGADVKLFRIAPFGLFDEVLRVTLSADLAPRYQNFGLGIGAWH